MSDSTHEFTTYLNTDSWAERIGWKYMPFCCYGDKSLPYVLHNHRKGTFFYTNDPGRPPAFPEA